LTLSSFPLSDTAKSWLILVVLSMIWGSSFILIKKSLIAFSPEQVACLRISISALAFIPFLAARFKRIDWKKWRYFLLVGVTGSALPSFLFAFAQTQINSTMAGILNSLTPLFTLILGMLFFGAPFILKKTGGVFLGLLGAILLILWSNDQGLSGHWVYALLVIGATICYATSVNTVGAFLKDVHSVTISAVSFSFMGLSRYTRTEEVVLGKLGRSYCCLRQGEKRRRCLSIGEAFQRSCRQQEQVIKSQITLIWV
jgi:drug/metabolite transporter (DMT)-like permease